LSEKLTCASGIHVNLRTYFDPLRPIVPVQP
jgi:hypothetical protein